MRYETTDDIMRAVEDLTRTIPRTTAKDSLTSAIRKAVRTLELKATNSLANNLCSDHRDKVRGRECLACEVEQLRVDFRTLVRAALTDNTMVNGRLLLRRCDGNHSQMAICADPECWLR